MISKTKIICTIGPESSKEDILLRLKDRGASFFRINLSHTEEEEIEEKIRGLLGYGIPIILDTEGSQVRTGNTSEIDLLEGSTIKIHVKRVYCDSSNLFFKPLGITSKLKNGDLISLEFNSVLLRVVDDGKLKDGYIGCKVMIGGRVGGKKAVQIESPTFNLPPFSKKDHLSVNLAKKYGIKHFTLSFMESPESILKFKQLYPEAIIYSKIESKKGLENFMEIAKVSNGILIDRGDLGTQIQLEKIPFIQKFILNKMRDLGKDAFVATNTLEQMAFSLKPNKAEVNDIINTILDGATGIALTKETAVGKYPVETVNMLSSLISQVEFIQKAGSNLIENMENTDYIYSDETPELLIKPQGGKLVDRYFPNYKGELPKSNIEIDEEALMDIEQIGVGAFSPLEGFLGKEDFRSVVDRCRLTSGIIWPLPIVLTIGEDKRKGLSEGEDVLLTYNGEGYGILHLSEIYKVDKNEEVQKIFGTPSIEHPGVKRFMSLGDYFLGGKITLLKRKPSIYKIHELTPKQTRRIFAERGWSKVVGFHTRNAIHKSHEFIQLEGLKRGLCDGLFVHPIIGKKKSGDFESEIIIESYEKMMEEFYPKSKVLMGTFASYSRYAGPREALFTAIIRKNFGCSHFIIGRDHTGVGNFYPPEASHEVFDKFTKEELGIVPIKFGEVFYSELEERYVHEPDFIEHPEESKLHLSGTQARDLFQKGVEPPEWFMRPEISKLIIEKIKRGEKVFVE